MARAPAMLWIDRSVRRSIFLLFAAVLATSAPAAAAPKSKPRERVVQLVTEGSKHYEAGRFQQSIELLLEAYELEKNPTILYNLARAYEGLGDSRSALDAYRQYNQADPKAADRGAVEQRIATLERQLLEKEKLERERDAAAKRAAAKRHVPPPPPPPPAEREPSLVPWIVAGVGAAIVGGGIYFGLRSRARHEEASDAALARDAANLNDEAKTFALIANVSFIAGGALALGGVSWGIVDRGASGERAGVTVRGQF
jgi:tetratricopeptide (TPR) repeat protein